MKLTSNGSAVGFPYSVATSRSEAAAVQSGYWRLTFSPRTVLKPSHWPEASCLSTFLIPTAR